MTETEASIALNMIPNVGPMRLRKMLEVFETPERILLARANALRAVEGIGADLADAIANWEKHVDLAAELKRVEEFGAHVITMPRRNIRASCANYNRPSCFTCGTLTERDHPAIRGWARARPPLRLRARNGSPISSLRGPHCGQRTARGIDTARIRARSLPRAALAVSLRLMDLYPPKISGLGKRSRPPRGGQRVPDDLPADRKTFRIATASSPAGGGLLVVEVGRAAGADHRRSAPNTAACHIVPGRLIGRLPWAHKLSASASS